MKNFELENFENDEITEGELSEETYEADETSYSDLEIYDFIVVQLKTAIGPSQRFIYILLYK